MEAYRTMDGTVAKFVHTDGSETAIKCVPSQSTFYDPASGRVETRLADRRKWSVFISSSVGCFMHCPFCHLEEKHSVFQKLSADQIRANVQEAVMAEVAARPELRQRWVKLCWMGMGDAASIPQAVRRVTLELLDWLLARGYARGLDGVDVSTVLPRVRDTWVTEFTALNRELGRFPVNPHNVAVEQAQLSTHCRYQNRSPFRLFYSLHSARQATRDRMVPQALPLAAAVPLLRAFTAEGARSLLFHQLFVQALNDSDEEVRALVAFLNTNFPGHELRVLRYNHCDRSQYQEWPQIDHALHHLAQALDRLKVQESAGTEVAAACGQFLVARPRVAGVRAPIQVARPRAG